MTLYKVQGSVDNTQGRFYVELLDDDQHLLEDRVNDLLGSAWTENGNFEISFDDSLFKDNILEFRPELFIVVRDENGKILHTSEKKRPSNSTDSKNLSFPNLLTKSDVKVIDSPYSSAFQRQLAAIQRISDGVDVDIGDLGNVTTLLLQSVNAMILYNNETVWKSVGYDGPQVPPHPRKKDHDHKLDWER